MCTDMERESSKRTRERIGVEDYVCSDDASESGIYLYGTEYCTKEVASGEEDRQIIKLIIFIRIAIVSTIVIPTCVKETGATINPELHTYVVNAPLTLGFVLFSHTKRYLTTTELQMLST